MLIIILFLYKDIMKYKESSLFSYQCQGYFKKKIGNFKYFINKDNFTNKNSLILTTGTLNWKMQNYFRHIQMY